MISVIATVVLSVLCCGLIVLIALMSHAELQDGKRYRWIRKAENYLIAEELLLYEKELDDEIDRHLELGQDYRYDWKYPEPAKCVPVEGSQWPTKMPGWSPLFGQPMPDEIKKD